MAESRVARRTFLKVTASALAAGIGVGERRAGAQTAVPNSSGTNLPRLKAPSNACDCHHHIYDSARFPLAAPVRRTSPMRESRSIGSCNSGWAPRAMSW